jgi:hypothetical protein
VTALARDLLAVLAERQPEEVMVARIAPDKRDKEWRIIATWPDKEGADSTAFATLDSRRGEIRSYVGHSLAKLLENTAGGRLRAAEDFARAHLGPLTDATTLVETSETMGRLFTYTWANVLPDGAWTGDWWCVSIDTSEKGVVGFLRQRAPRTVAEEEVKVTREQALSVASHAMHVRDVGQMEARKIKLVLSSPDSPDLGPVWSVTLSEGGHGEPCLFVVDGTTGKLLGQ